MIILHAMEAPYDLPGIDIRKGDTMYHLLSDVPGPEGTAELLAFVRACGGHDAWVQSPGTYREHFDIFGRWADRAHALGAHVAGSHEVSQILTRKRAAMAGAVPSVPTLTDRQMRGLDHLLKEEYGIAPAQRMELAAAALMTLMRQMALQSRTVAVLVGPGRTGATALVAARLLANAGVMPRVWLAASSAERHADATVPMATLTAMGIPVNHTAPPTTEDLAQADLLVDALLGYGTDGTPRGAIATAITTMNAAGTPILALDLPSGLDPNEEGPYAPCVRASATLALGLPLRGLTMSAAAGYVGDIWLADIGMPRRAPKRVGARLGHIFAASSLVHLSAAPIAGAALASEVRQLRVSPTPNPSAPLSDGEG